MRKADYQALADIIKRQRESAYRAAADARAVDNSDSANFAEGKASALELAADCFAREASVDRAAFLKACGIDP